MICPSPDNTAWLKAAFRSSCFATFNSKSKHVQTPRPQDITEWDS